MAKRGFKFGTYDTAEKGWTLTGWEFTEPELIENYITVPGRLDGPLDASAALTDGDVRYGSRKLTAVFECSEGTRAERDTLIREMRTRLDGDKIGIRFPDDSDHHAMGRLRIEKLYNDLAHASVRVTAICEPWLYRNSPTNISLKPEDTPKTESLINEGRRIVVPTVSVVVGPVTLLGEGDGGFQRRPHTMPYTTLSEGTYQLPDFYINPLETFSLEYYGGGFLELSYREAIL
jgi:hypothetical protein